MRPILAVALLASALLGARALAQDDQSLLGWSQATARGMLDLCRQDAPDAGRVMEHGEIWGWPHFMAYLETPEGYKRAAGGESRRSYRLGDATANVEVSVQSGEAPSSANARIQYFRCDIASDQPIEPDLEAYFTALHGPATAKTDNSIVWLLGASAGGATDGDDAALQAVAAQGAGAKGERIELSREEGRDRAKLTEFRDVAAR